MVDTLRQDRVGAYGYSRPTTPRIDALADRGALADGLSPTSWTRPSVATVFTGLHPLRHQVVAPSDRIPADAPLLAEALRAAGYSSLGISTNGHVSPAWGFGRGFDRFYSTWKMGLGPRPPADAVNRALHPDLPGLTSPFFLYVHYLDPHLPYDPPFGYDGRPLPPELAAATPWTEPDLFDSTGRVDPRRLKIASDLYDGEVRAVDAALGDLLDALDAVGRLRDTLVVVVSDHGEEIGDHGSVGHGRTLFEEVVRVPLVLAGPGVPAGVRVGEFPLEDLAPTILGLLGVPFDPGAVDGRNRAAELAGAPRADAIPAPRLLHTESVDGAAAVAVRSGSRKLVLGRDPYRKELFDLEHDPREAHDLLEPGEPEVNGLGAQTAELARRYGDLVRRSLRRETTDADRELAEQIAALGYGAARSQRYEHRLLPARLRPADLFPDGLRGWEPLDRFLPCVAILDPVSAQLLEGWYTPEPAAGGRWARATASFAVSLVAGRSARIVIEAESFAPGVRRVTLERLGGPEKLSREIGPGALRLELALDAARDSVALLRLEVDPPYAPAEAGLADNRLLGLFVRSICSAGDAPLSSAPSAARGVGP